MGITIHDFKMTGIRLDPVSGVTVSLFDDSVQGSYDLVFGRVRKASIDRILNWLGLVFFSLIFLRSSSYLALKVYAIGHLERGDYFVMLPLALGSLLICGMFVAIVLKNVKSNQ